MKTDEYIKISGKRDGLRLSSRILEEEIQKAVEKGHRKIVVDAYGQHGIGGRLFRTEGDVKIVVEKQSGQRVGSFGYFNTEIEVMGPASDDVGWLNAGARIVVHGNAGNGVANAMAQGRIYVDGNIGARGMTMTKHNPKFDPPELWVLGSAGDYFAEFMAGGICVICGHNPQDAENVLGYRPFVGMVGGSVFFRGRFKDYSKSDAKLVEITDDDWEFLQKNIKDFLESINKTDLFDTFKNRRDWRLIKALSPFERTGKESISMSSFRTGVWERELGKGGIVGDIYPQERTWIPLITTGEMRRFVPVWENGKYAAPCQNACPTGIPVQKRWRLVREGLLDEAVDDALLYSPFPATVCGHLCPNLCMGACTRKSQLMEPIDVALLGKASINAKKPGLPELSGRKIAVIGGGPAGISAAWQLRLRGHEPVLFDTAPTLGGKISSAIPDSRIPREVVDAELNRVSEVISDIRLNQSLSREDVERMKTEFDFIIAAAGAQKPVTIPIPGADDRERVITALDFLRSAKSGSMDSCDGKRVVIIGAGNVGCDVAAEASRLGASDVLLIDIQSPASFGKEREEAEKAGARFRWPVFTKAVTHEGVELEDGEVIPADMVVMAVGDAPNLDFLPESVIMEKGFAAVNEFFQTSDPKIFAIGDAVKPGLLTDAIGAGGIAARAVDAIINHKKPSALSRPRPVIDRSRVSLEYFDPKITGFHDSQGCGSQCSSCGDCRDCGICIDICPQTAISRTESGDDDFEYAVDEKRCIGCGFCAGACPCGIWALVANEPVE